MMTDKMIKKLLLELNQKKAGGYVVTRPLSDTVDFAKVWLNKPSIGMKVVTLRDQPPSTFYFIKGKESDKYCAAVLLFENDMNWYILPEYRKGNAFINTLKETVLPHVLQHIPVQRMMLNSALMGEKVFLYSRKIATSAGFKAMREENGIVRFSIEAASIGPRDYIAGRNTGISDERLREISIELNAIIQILEMTKTEILMKTGMWQCTEDYETIIKDLKNRQVNLDQLKLT
jgi:hypothetical protein